HTAKEKTKTNKRIRKRYIKPSKRIVFVRGRKLPSSTLMSSANEGTSTARNAKRTRQVCRFVVRTSISSGFTSDQKCTKEILERTWMALRRNDRQCNHRTAHRGGG